MKTSLRGLWPIYKQESTGYQPLKRMVACAVVCLLTALAFMPSTAFAQRWRSQRQHRQTESEFVKRYMSLLNDTIPADSASTDSAAASRKSQTKTVIPNQLVFDDRIAPGLLSLHSDSDSLTRLRILSLYLRRPDLVATTRRHLKDVGTIVEPTHVDNDIIELTPSDNPDYGQVAIAPIDNQSSHSVKLFKPNFWTFSGDYYLQLLQNYVSDNWYKGGEKNYSLVSSLTLQANYNNKQKVRWDNKLEMKLGFQTSESDTLHSLKTNNDLIRYTSKLGLQATRRWYYTIQMISSTQFMRSFATNSDYVYADFMSPFTLNLSIGMDYQVQWLNNKLTGSVHLAPLAYNFKHVNRKELASRYGIDAGKHNLHDYGSEFTCDLTWKISNLLKWQTRLYGYTTYERSELEWENTFSLQFNKYVSAKLFVYPRFDDGVKRDDKHGYFQFKEYFSLGFSYDF